MIIIKNIMAEHLHMLCSLEKRLFDDNSFPMSKRAFRYHIKKGSLLIGAFENDRLVGYALIFLYKFSARIYSIGVDGEYQKMGLGRAIIEKVFDIVKEKKIKKILLEARVDNIKAMRAYKKLGFKERGKLEKYYPDGKDGIKMEFCFE